MSHDLHTLTAQEAEALLAVALADDSTPIVTETAAPASAPEKRGQRETDAQSPFFLPFKILIVGPSGSGKSTFAGLLAERLGVRVGETSAVLMAEAVALFEQAGLTSNTRNEQEWYQKKSFQARRELVAVGDLITKFAPDYMLRVAAKDAEILVGARRKVELDAWYYNGTGSKRDVLIEIEGGDDSQQDNAYELAGWALEVHGFTRFVVPPKDETWPAKADAVADALRGLVERMKPHGWAQAE